MPDPMALLNAVPDYLYLYEVQADRILWRNRSLMEFLGYTLQESAEMTEDFRACLMHPDDRENFEQRQAARAHLRPGASLEFDIRLRHRTGEWRWLHTRETVFQQCDGSGVVEVVFGIVQDVTVRREDVAVLVAAAERQEHIAETLQTSLITPDPQRFPGVEICALYQAALEEARIGGDFYDQFSLEEDNKIVLVVGDVMGKGLKAAARTAEIKYTLRALLREYSDTPEIALARMNQQMYPLEGAETPVVFVCLSLAILDCRTGEVWFGVAGIEPPLILRAATGKVEAFRGGGMPLGVSSRWYQDEEHPVAPLAPGDLLMLYTDGLTESCLFPAEREGTQAIAVSLRNALATGRSKGDMPSLEHFAESIAEDAARDAGGPLLDDVCLLLARYTG
jgi:PAS domain S-box-containing protein